MKGMSCSPNEDTDNFLIVARVLQEDILAMYMFKLSLDYVLRAYIGLMKKMVSHWKDKNQMIPTKFTNDFKSQMT